MAFSAVGQSTVQAPSIGLHTIGASSPAGSTRKTSVPPCTPMDVNPVPANLSQSQHPSPRPSTKQQGEAQFIFFLLPRSLFWSCKGRNAGLVRAELLGEADVVLAGFTAVHPAPRRRLRQRRLQMRRVLHYDRISSVSMPKASQRRLSNERQRPLPESHRARRACLPPTHLPRRQEDWRRRAIWLPSGHSPLLHKCGRAVLSLLT